MRRRHERKPNALPQNRAFCRIGIRRDSTSVRNRLNPVLASPLNQRVKRRRTRGRCTLLHRALPPLSLRKLIQTDVRCDSVEPGPQRSAAIESVEALPGPDHGLLRRIIGIYDRAEHPVTVARQRRSMDLDLLHISHHLGLTYHTETVS